MYIQIIQVTARFIETSLILFILYRFLRWHLYYYEMRKNKCASYNFMNRIIRKLYVKPDNWLKQRNHFFGLELPIEVYDYSEGQEYYVKSKQK